MRPGIYVKQSCVLALHLSGRSLIRSIIFPRDEYVDDYNEPYIVTGRQIAVTTMINTGPMINPI